MTILISRLRYFVTDTYFPADVTQSEETYYEYFNRLANALNLFYREKKQINQKLKCEMHMGFFLKKLHTAEAEALDGFSAVFTTQQCPDCPFMSPDS